MNKSSEDILSVCLITYNHEKFVEQAIDSILKQETNFDWKLIIADDCSKDETRAIILKYKEKFLDKIDIIFQEKNVGPAQNWIDLITAPKSKYIAYMEGDDYWTDSLKLQKQVDFLENNNDYNLVGHYSRSSEGKEMGVFKIDTFEFKDIYQKNLRIPSASFLFRNNIIYPDWIYDAYGGDRALIFLNAQKGKLKILPFFGSFYRIHEGGVESILKKDKFKVGIRNIKEEFLYYKILKNEYDVSLIKRKIYKNHFYILALSIYKIRPIHFFKGLKSVLYFSLDNKIKY